MKPKTISRMLFSNHAEAGSYQNKPGKERSNPMKATNLRWLTPLLAAALVAALLVALPAGAVLAEDGCQTLIIVTDPGDSGQPGQLRTAIAQVCDGGTVQIAETLTGPIVLFPAIVIDKAVTVQGNGRTTLSASWSSLFLVAPTGNLILDNATLGGEPGGWGRRTVEVQGQATLTDVTLTNSSHAVWAHPGSSVILAGNTLVTGNVSDSREGPEGGAGIYNDGGSVTLKDQTAVTGNYNWSCGTPMGSLAYWGVGGGIFNKYGSITLEDRAQVSGNWLRQCDPDRGYYGGYGGGIGSFGGSVTLKDFARVSGNTAIRGGGIWGWQAEVTINGHASVDGNITKNSSGAGVFNWGGEVTLNDAAAITGNTAEGPEPGTPSYLPDYGYGGGVYCTSYPGYPSPILAINDRASISGNTAQYGGGVYNASGEVTLSDRAAITGNTARSQGGGIHNTQVSGLSAPLLVINNKAAITDNNPDDIYPAP